MRLTRKQLGQLGEELAVETLIGLGYSISTRNWRCSIGEIDIIARDGETWVFVEVKLRASSAYGSPEEAVNSRKQAKLLGSALAFIETLELRDEPPWRVDVIAIEVNKEGHVKRLDHYQDAVRADG